MSFMDDDDVSKDTMKFFTGKLRKTEDYIGKQHDLSSIKTVVYIKDGKEISRTSLNVAKSRPQKTEQSPELNYRGKADDSLFLIKWNKTEEELDVFISILIELKYLQEEPNDIKKHFRIKANDSVLQSNLQLLVWRGQVNTLTHLVLYLYSNNWINVFSQNTELSAYFPIFEHFVLGIKKRQIKRSNVNSMIKNATRNPDLQFDELLKTQLCEKFNCDFITQKKDV